MQLPRNSPSPIPPIATRQSWRSGSAALLLTVVCALEAGCGASAPPPRAAPVLAAGRPAGWVAGPQLAAGAHLAKRFAAAYARGAYLRRPLGVPGATASVNRELALAAKRVPPDRRRLRPRLLSLALQPEHAATLSAGARIGDGRSPPFSIAFTVSRVGGRWRVVAISLPG